MTLAQKIRQIYPDLSSNDFVDFIVLQDNSDNNGAFIAKWEHPTLTQPTQAQLDAVGKE